MTSLSLLALFVLSPGVLVEASVRPVSGDDHLLATGDELHGGEEVEMGGLFVYSSLGGPITGASVTVRRAMCKTVVFRGSTDDRGAMAFEGEKIRRDESGFELKISAIGYSTLSASGVFLDDSYTFTVNQRVSNGVNQGVAAKDLMLRGEEAGSRAFLFSKWSGWTKEVKALQAKGKAGCGYCDPAVTLESKQALPNQVLRRVRVRDAEGGLPPSGLSIAIVGSKPGVLDKSVGQLATLGDGVAVSDAGNATIRMDKLGFDQLIVFDQYGVFVPVPVASLKVADNPIEVQIDFYKLIHRVELDIRREAVLGGVKLLVTGPLGQRFRPGSSPMTLPFDLQGWGMTIQYATVDGQQHAVIDLAQYSNLSSIEIVLD